jgi:hypothetical protein
MLHHVALVRTDVFEEHNIPGDDHLPPGLYRIQRNSRSRMVVHLGRLTPHQEPSWDERPYWGGLQSENHQTQAMGKESETDLRCGHSPWKRNGMLLGYLELRALKKEQCDT